MHKKSIYQITSISLIILATISLSNLAKHPKVLAQTTSKNSTILETKTSSYHQVQKNLISQNKYQAALEISEHSRNRTLVKLLVQQLTISEVNPPSTEQIKQVAKQQNATLVQYSIINDEVIIDGKKQTQESELYIWVIKPTGEIAFRSVDLKPLWHKENTSLADLIIKSRQSIGVVSSNLKGGIKVPDQNLTNSNQRLQKLHQLLIQPIADLLPTQPDEHIIFIPQSELFLVPFVALQNAKGKYLIEQHTIATAPSIQVLDLLYQRQQQNKGVAKNVLVVGNPTISSQPGKSHQLLGAEQEAKAIAHLFNTQALIGDTATETAVVQRMPQAKIIHLATTACPHDRQGLALTPSAKDDGLLTSEEILNLKLKAELVVLSANDTALGKITNDGVIGLSRSFFSAGVSSVIGSLWDISDQQTAFLMIEFYQKLSKNPDKAVALRYAMLATMKKYPNPQYWAAFTLIGVL
ncbi:CHAT domain-containing protein [Nostoc sp. 'Peltigera membranacea cyanobiont' 213]|uniref:CHAT domain-containing protein n=1 Tax=Nostoc sp. 'Peltigera membranacea cyanobiont' 213 TaxID=2014530 RepID=UPI000B95059A|nr:CHAT domain-containing protein [Nostoc sp. 'Peltigera membranacea cyanobiont' 213]OYD94981.1 CHAT domain-containing protein [Nostoc sp. 'Peltigera membranacea cyanobiont' 213]